MAEEITKEFIQKLARANGLEIPEERLEVVLRQYQSFLRTLERLESLPLPREADPATVFSLERETGGPANSPPRRQP